MDKLTASGMAERSEAAPVTSVNTSAYIELDTLTSDNHLLDSDLSIHSYNIQLQTMADRFPSLEDFSEGMSQTHLSLQRS
jgi:hypothetical protein